MKRLTLTPLTLFAIAALAFTAGSASAAQPLAKVGDTVLSDDQLRQDMPVQLYQAENSLYNVQKAWIDQKAQEIVFDRAAKDAGLSRKDWEAKEIDAKLPPVDQGQVQQLAGRYAGPNVSSMETIKKATEALQVQSRQVRRVQLYQELQQKYPVQVMITKPEAPRLNVTYAADDPMLGNAKAPVTIVEFTDFQCPYCKRSQETLRQVEKTYGDKVKIVARQYPLPFHNRAQPSAEAAMCAREQGKFWPYRDKLFADQKLEEADLQRYAQEIGLNMKKFDKCYADHKYAERIKNDIAEGQKFGVTGTPAFFVNGEMINGAQPFPAFQAAIDNALAQKK